MHGVAPQNRHVTSVTKRFLDVHWDRQKPLLLGYSGGPDSKALLYALLECDVKPHLAHVDHGWREESADEAEKLRLEAMGLGLPFYSTRLQIAAKEDEARKARLNFFRSIAEPYAALLLAHQADDLAETVLKRILEGAHLAYSAGMESVTNHSGLPIWRPFLTVRRSEILQFLEENTLDPIIDASNFDPKYLRSRMRLDILPVLNEQFGKEVTGNLLLFAERAAELKHYLDQKIASTPIHRGPWGVWVDLNGLARIEQRHLLQKLGREESISFSRPVLETLLDWAQAQVNSKRLDLKMKKIFVDRARIWIFSSTSTHLFSN